MDIKSIFSRAPTRIDLAGGTVDLWPLYLFLKDPVTINLGIDLFAEAKVDLKPSRTSADRCFLLRSEDQNIELKLPWGALEHAVDVHPALELHYKLLRHFSRSQKSSPSSKQDFDLSLTTQARSPAGAGLGGSSALSVAIVGALATWANEKIIDPLRDGEKLVDIVRDIETTVIQVPAGVQDYYGAMFGGLQTLHWGAGTHQRSWFSDDILTELDQRLLLFYSGQSRNSGINNWALFKAFIDKQGDTRTKFEKITQATQDLEVALYQKNWKAVAGSIANEWAVRRTLAPGITTPEMDQAFAEAQKIAHNKTPVSGKVCGAGGGGCFFIYLSEPSNVIKEQIQEAFVRQGMRPLPFRAVPSGVDVQVNRA